MKNIPNGLLEDLSRTTGLSRQHISDYLNNRRNMSKSRAIDLEKHTLEKGSFFTRENWMFHPDKIRQSLMKVEAA